MMLTKRTTLFSNGCTFSPEKWAKKEFPPRPSDLPQRQPGVAGGSKPEKIHFRFGSFPVWVISGLGHFRFGSFPVRLFLFRPTIRLSSLQGQMCHWVYYSCLIHCEQMMHVNKNRYILINSFLGRSNAERVLFINFCAKVSNLLLQ